MRRRMAQCECGCGKDSASEFLPGHDQKLRVALERRVGGLLSLRTLVNASEDYAFGKCKDDDLTQVARSLFFKARASEI